MFVKVVHGAKNDQDPGDGEHIVRMKLVPAKDSRESKIEASYEQKYCRQEPTGKVA